jgi:hypothetical protein
MIAPVTVSGVDLGAQGSRAAGIDGQIDEEGAVTFSGNSPYDPYRPPKPKQNPTLESRHRPQVPPLLSPRQSNSETGNATGTIPPPAISSYQQQLSSSPLDHQEVQHQHHQHQQFPQTTDSSFFSTASSTGHASSTLPGQSTHAKALEKRKDEEEAAAFAPLVGADERAFFEDEDEEE